MIRSKNLRHSERYKTNHKTANMSHNTHKVFTDIKQLKMSLSTSLQAGEGVEVQLHPLSVSALDGCERSTSRPQVPYPQERNAMPTERGNYGGSREFMDF